MERLTEKRGGQNVIPLRQDGKTKWSLCSAGMGDASTQFLYGEHADKLAELEDLEEQGKLLKLPCAVGDMVYVLRIDNTAYMTNNKKVWEIAEERFEIRHFDSIGKTVFLTRQEAEQALKEMEGKK